jgi:hypothetical protein
MLPSNRLEENGVRVSGVELGMSGNLEFFTLSTIFRDHDYCSMASAAAVKASCEEICVQSRSARTKAPVGSL